MDRTFEEELKRIAKRRRWAFIELTYAEKMVEHNRLCSSGRRALLKYLMTVFHGAKETTFTFQRRYGINEKVEVEDLYDVKYEWALHDLSLWSKECEALALATSNNAMYAYLRQQYGSGIKVVKTLRWLLLSQHVPRKSVLFVETWLKPAMQNDFLQKVDTLSSPDGCWLWKGATKDEGYGKVFLRMPNGSIERTAHRAAFIWWVAALTKARPCVLHRSFCNNRNCLNPSHLYAGTKEDNTNDRIAWGSNNYSSGMNNPNSKLTELQVRVIRSLYSRTRMSQQKLADIFGTTDTAIWSVVNRKTWPNL